MTTPDLFFFFLQFFGFFPLRPASARGFQVDAVTQHEMRCGGGEEGNSLFQIPFFFSFFQVREKFGDDLLVKLTQISVVKL